ncbi:MAG TPA: HNH endonuclease signature motif containing protein [Candidatus Pacearchaeota archaeon]|nr:HNH endonuclease [Candidatus Parcubacteria bacterium]HNP79529.1 HNH endonuclease signature motif containing protein [Candidatus Pacearchaeota archaeon]
MPNDIIILMKKRSWTKTQLETAIKKAYSYREVLKLIGLRPTGGNYVQLKKYIKEYGFDAKHFKGKAWNRGLEYSLKNKIPLENILNKDSFFQSFKLKKRLIKEGFKPPYCEECGWAKRSEDGRLPLELHHIDGDTHNNCLDNLQILCPNCHSLKPNYRGQNKTMPR